MICPSKILQELIELLATRGYTRVEARKRAERILQRATV